jgi:hypothetical protein
VILNIGRDTSSRNFTQILKVKTSPVYFTQILKVKSPQSILLQEYINTPVSTYGKALKPSQARACHGIYALFFVRVPSGRLYGTSDYVMGNYSGFVKWFFFSFSFHIIPNNDKTTIIFF